MSSVVKNIMSGDTRMYTCVHLLYGNPALFQDSV